jgi:hypothetical protein
MKPLSLFVLVALVAGVLGCTGSKKDTAAPPPKAPEGARVAKVVVLEQETGCECALARQEVTWTNLQAALESLDQKPAVDVIHFDVEPGAAQPFQDMKAVMVVPALYFLDGDGALVAAEQGELTAETITALLGSPGA